ncbi:hypothetical protein EVAR_20662_1 [Eumeta japonica]|uniref:Uncharacterized protein n=1 Tax=Eumeta variegata TaxID=151549 RepID=A0A4C1VAR5_EUMVA|nr:hypothetical protein EVAR_20662_1 [Eumeta japonica]
MRASERHASLPLGHGTKKNTTLAQTIVEIRKAADELFQLSEMDVKACTKQRKRRTKEKQKEHTFPLYLLTHYSIYYLSRIQFLAKGCTNTGWLCTPVTPNPS